MLNEPPPLWFTIGCLIMTARAMEQRKFTPVTTSTGAEVCATDVPTTTSWLLMDMIMQCGLQCLIAPTCLFYNFNTRTGRCDLYQNIYPISYAVVPGCKGYQTGVNKCSADNGGCSQNATCVCSPANVTCACKPGFNGDGFSCTVCKSAGTLFVTADNIVHAVYVNGYAHTFNTGTYWSQARAVPLPCVVQTIAVYAQNNGGANGILVWDSNNTIHSTAQWKCNGYPTTGWTSLSFNDSTWPAAVVQAVYGGGSWGSQVTNSYGPAPTAASYWIWAAQPSGNAEAYCRVTLE